MNNTPLKVLADGTQIPSEDPRTDHVAVLFPDGWMVAVAPLTAPEGEEFDNADLADNIGNLAQRPRHFRRACDMHHALIDADGIGAGMGKRAPQKGVTHFTRTDGQRVVCEVLDLSVSGVSLKTDVRPPVGEYVLIGHMAGRVARHHESGIGIEFVGGTEKGAPEKLLSSRLSVVRQ